MHAASSLWKSGKVDLNIGGQTSGQMRHYNIFIWFCWWKARKERKVLHGDIVKIKDPVQKRMAETTNSAGDSINTYNDELF